MTTLMLGKHQTWRAFAACNPGPDATDEERRAAVERFFPNDRHVNRASAKEADEAAKTVCRGCPVQAQCLDEALSRQQFGIWGGTNENDRAALRASRAKESA